MATTLSVVNEMTYHAYRLAARTPVGQSAILCGADFAATVTRMERVNTNYWTITMSAAKNAFRGVTLAHETTQAHVWLGEDGRWTVDYHQGIDTVEVTACRELAAALSVAAWSVAERGHGKGLW